MANHKIEIPNFGKVKIKTDGSTIKDFKVHEKFNLELPKGWRFWYDAEKSEADYLNKCIFLEKIESLGDLASVFHEVGHLYYFHHSRIENIMSHYTELKDDLFRAKGFVEELKCARKNIEREYFSWEYCLDMFKLLDINLNQFTEVYKEVKGCLLSHVMDYDKIKEFSFINPKTRKSHTNLVEKLKTDYQEWAKEIMGSKKDLLGTYANLFS